MGIANLYNSFNDYPTQSNWAFSNADEHFKIIDAIYRQYGITLASYILDPMPDARSPNIGQWAYNHQAAHTAFTSLLGIGGQDLTSVDFTKQDQIDAWLWNHAYEHKQAQLILGYQD